MILHLLLHLDFLIFTDFLCLLLLILACLSSVGFHRAGRLDLWRRDSDCARLVSFVCWENEYDTHCLLLCSVEFMIITVRRSVNIAKAVGGLVAARL